MEIRNIMKHQLSIMRATILALLIAAAAVVVGGPAAYSSPLAQGKGQAGQGQPVLPSVSVGTDFSYQGSLKDGANPANGQYDFTFKLYDALSGGNQVGSTLSLSDEAVTDGMFSIELDFGPGAFTGQAMWLEIAVRQAGGGTYTTLSPRQPLTAAPYAQSLVPGALVEGTSPSSSAILKVTNNASGAYGLWGVSTSSDGIGVLGSGNNTSQNATGVYGISGGTGVTGFAAVKGVYGLASGLSGWGVHGVSNNGVNAIGVRGESTNGFGVYGLSTNLIGVYGESSTNRGVWGKSTSSYGGYFESFGSTSTAGVYASATNGIGVQAISTTNIGVSGISQSSNPGVRGQSTGSYGVAGYSYGSGMPGIYGQNLQNTGYGVQGVSNSGYAGVYGNSSSNNGTGVIGVANNGSSAAGVAGTSSSGYGVTGSSTSSYGVLGNSGGDFKSGVYGSATGNYGVGIVGVATGLGGYGVVGSANYVDAAYAGYFDGSVNINGDLYLNGGCQGCLGPNRIDHPLDPQNKYLYHSPVQSDNMMDIYNGNVTLDVRGEAVVQLPDWFEALNKEFRYQLTPVGAPGPNLYVAEKIKGNHFRIAGGPAGIEVSWQVTGVRNDPYAQDHPLHVEVAKPADEKGKYLYPDGYGQPESQGISYQYSQQLTKTLIQSNSQTP